MAIAAQVEMAVGQESGQFSPEFELLLACCQSGRLGDRLTQPLRSPSDLDLLVRPRNVVQTKAVLQQLGYEPQLQLSPRQEKAYLHSGYEYVFGLNDDRNLLELQWQILPRFYAVEFDIEPMFKQSIEIKIEGFRVRSLCREDLMLVLCVHAAKHGWAHLGMLRDIATLADFELDWE